LYQGGSTVDAVVANGLQAGEGRDRRSIVECVHNGGFLAGKVCVRCLDDFDLRRVDAGTPSITNGLIEAIDVASRHIEDDSIRIERCRGERCAVEHQMGSVRQKEGVFAAGRLSLGPVGHHHCPATSALQRPPLRPNGKPGSAVAPKAAGIKFVQERGPCAMEWQIAPLGEMHFQVDDGVTRSEGTQQAREPGRRRGT
jgi:hypothetical protein